MKVLKVIHTLGHGGAENTFRWLAWGLLQRGVEVVAAIPSVTNAQRENWITPALETVGVPYLTFDTSGSPWRLLCNVVKVIDWIRPDIVHSHLLDSNFYSSLACSLRSVPHVCTEHGDISLQKSARTRIKYQVISLCSRRFVCVSRGVQDSVAGVVWQKHKLRTVHNGIRFLEKKPSSFRAEYKIPDGAVLVGNVGNLYPVKGHKYLVQAFGELLKSSSADLYLVLVGRGGERENLSRLAGELGIPNERVILTGYRGDVENIMNAIDLYVQPSLSEGHPLAVIEAMSLGIPVVATAVGGTPELVGPYGTLVEPGSWQDLHRVMELFLSNRREFMEKVPLARDNVRETLSIDTMALKYLDVYQQALAAHRK